MNRPAAVALATLTMAATGFAGCGGSSSGSSSNAAETQKPTEGDRVAKRAEQLDVVVDEPSDEQETTKTSILISGTVTPADAKVVVVNGDEPSPSPDGRWKTRLDLELGRNFVGAKASVDGTTVTASDSVNVTRKRTAAQSVAYKAAQARKRVARKAAQARKREERLTSLRANAQAIAPKLLQKNPDKYSDEQVVVSGEIFQIQEGQGDNFFLINTECTTEFEVRLCDGPTVHVAYDSETSKGEDDLVTVYGTVIGGLDYDTAAGGSNYVASIEADIIE